MEEFLVRLQQEEKELAERLDKLNAFLISDKFHNVTPVQQSLLKIQASAMSSYRMCLRERLDDFGALQD